MFDHWELDTIVSSRGKSKACFATFLERQTRFYVAISNENSNGLLREYYPKKTDLGKVTEEDLIEKLILLNTRPRKCLNWKTPFKLFLDKLKCCT